MPWLPKDQWNDLKRGIGCPMCTDVHLPENEHSFLITTLEHSHVRLPKNQYMRGWTLVAARRHVCELFEMDPTELAGFWRDVSLVANALDQRYHPAKINYGVFGNLCPHLHCHLVVQRYDDDPEKPLNMREREVFLDAAEYREEIAALQQLVERIGTEARG